MTGRSLTLPGQNGEALPADSVAPTRTPPLARRRSASYGYALVYVTLATAVTWLIWPAIKPQVSPLFFLAVMLAARQGGLGPGLLATGLSGFISIYVFSDPVFSLKVEPEDFLRVGAFLVVAVAVSALADARRRAEAALRAAHADLERRVDERTRELAAVNQSLKREVAERRAAELNLVEHQARLQDLATEVVLAEQRERRRIAERLHDDLGQILALSQIRLGTVRDVADPAKRAEELEAVESLVEEAISRTRSITCDLSPPVLYELGLEAALQWLVGRLREQSGVRFTVHCSGDARGLSEEQRFTLFQIARELLANAVKHASARSVSVLLSCGAADVSVVVQDDGVGFDANAGEGAAAANSFGLFSIRERLKRHGGTLRILSERGAGAQVTAWLPRDKRRGGHDPG